MKKVRVLKDFGCCYHKGEIITTFHQKVAQRWVDKGLCEWVEESPNVKAIESPRRHKMVDGDLGQNKSFA